MNKRGDTCHYCNEGILKMKVSKYGSFLACSIFPRCAGRVVLHETKSELEKLTDDFLKANKNL